MKKRDREIVGGLKVNIKYKGKCLFLLLVYVLYRFCEYSFPKVS